MTSGDIKSIKTLSNLKTLDLSRNCLFQIPQELSSLTALEELDLSFQKIEEKEFNCSHLAQLKALKSLSLWGNSINPQSLESLHTLEKLECLDLSECRLGPVEKQFFQLPKNLKLLDLGFTEIGSEVLAEISLLKNLERLNLAEYKFEKEDFENLQLPVSLKRLVLCNTKSNPGYIKTLLSLKNLTHLDITDETTISLKELEALNTLNLKSLKLSFHHVDGECFKILETFRSLEELTLLYHTGDDDALRSIKNLPNLKKIRMMHTW
jgi:Leucine-rich repeat (LRR) protein